MVPTPAARAARHFSTPAQRTFRRHKNSSTRSPLADRSSHTPRAHTSHLPHRTMFSLSATSTAAVVRAPRTAQPARRSRCAVATKAAMNADTVQAMGDRVLVLADAAESQTKGGLFLASSGGSSGPGSNVTGKVASVGEAVKGVKKGDKVLINGFAGTEVEFEGGVKGKFVNSADVLAVLS